VASHPSAAALKGLSAAEYAQLSALLDEALELPPEARSAWLASLAAREPRTATLLRQLFVLQSATHGDGFLEDRGPLLRQLVDTAEADPGLVGREFGPYRVLSLLGHGGMGSVWLAERVDGLFKRQVALKLVHPALTGPTTAERFAREREILASLDHPNIAGLLDAGFASDGQAYLALEYVRGTPLTVYCDDHRLSLRARLALFRKVLSAVQHAHAHLVIHRDLKPSNILVSEDGEVHLLDFGIAKLLAEGEARETQLTRLGGAALTPDYAAPEQIAGAPITTATDVYALGVMLYELLTGERPYRLGRDSRGALEEAILRTDPAAPSHALISDGSAEARGTTPKKLARALQGDLDTITLKALKKSPRERYATVNAFAEDIGRYLSGQVVLAQPDSAVYRLVKFARRRWAAISVAAVLILTLAGGLAATSYEARVASAQRDAALQAQLRSLTQTAAARLREGDVPAAMAMILEVLPAQKVRPYAPEALAVFQEARAGDAQLLALNGHSGKLRSAVFSPDGRRIATSADDGTARIWDATLGEELQRLRGHTARVRSVAFSPDGGRIATSSNDGTARIWDGATGRELLRLAGHSADVSAAAFSPDGERLLTTSLDHTARVWDAATGRELLRLQHPDSVNWGAFSPDGRRIVTGSSDNVGRIWDAVTGRELARLEGHTDRVSAVGFSPEGGRIATGSYDHTARLWDAATGRQLTLLRGHTALVSSVAFSPDGTRVVTSSADRSARLWDAATGVELASFAGDNDQLSSAAFSPDGTRIVAACLDDTARVWDVDPIHETTRIAGHAARVSSASFSPDGRRILTSSYDRTARVWDASSSQSLLVLNGHDDWVALADFSPDGSRIVTASADKTARVWDASTGRPELLLRGHDARLVAAVFSPDGRRIATASTDKTARIWDALTGRELTRLSGHTDRVEFAAYSPDGTRIVTSSYDRTARIWDATDGRPVALLSGHTDRLTSAVFSPDGARVLSASDDGTARIWDAASAREILRLRGYSRSDVHITGAMFSPDGGRIVTSASDGTARLWDAATGEQLGIVARHTELVESAVFARDGRHVLTASDDRTARVWDAAAPQLDVQLAWADAAQFHHLSNTQRFELGLPAANGVRAWPRDRSSCDDLAAAPYDPDRRAPGVMLERLTADVALRACASERQRSGNSRGLYQHGRALMASGAFAAARADFERAASEGYRAARLDLASLLSQPSARLLDLPRAISLYGQAWHDGVSAAAFALGGLYEHGVRAEGRSDYLLAPDPTRSNEWFRKAEAAGEPNALARLAGQEVRAASLAATGVQQNADLLTAFRHYAAAAERARREDWPDDAWRPWRYRRASLARLLARAGMTQEVARLYDGVRDRQASPASTFWQRLAARFRDDP
jgi:WD40 repeat protein/tRNA A-37 threonylcarbamoyl transferase component Bud32/TPR repeat protein